MYCKQFKLIPPWCRTLLAVASLALTLNLAGEETWNAGKFEPPEAASGPDTTPGALVADLPSFACASFRWFIKGDKNYNCKVAMKFREKGTGAWLEGFPMLRVHFAPLQKNGESKIGPWRKGKTNQNMLAGSIFNLKPDTYYEVQFALSDPDGGAAEKTLEVRTRALPKIPSSMRTIEATPETLDEALKGLKAGDRVLLAPGRYKAIQVSGKGSADAPVMLEGADAKKVIVEGGVSFSGEHVWIRRMTVIDAQDGIRTNSCPFAIVSECHVTASHFGIFMRGAQGAIVMDNVVKGPCVWPRSKGIEAPHGIETKSPDMIVTHNRVSGFGDGISNNNYFECNNWEVCYNDVSECTDDGIEIDFCSQNARVYRNRWTNVYNTISVAPTWGGPVYVIRNEMYNVKGPFKLQRHPTGIYFLNNSVYAIWRGLQCPRGESWYNLTMHNNLLVGRTGKSFEVTPGKNGVDVDYNGHGYSAEGDPFGKWNGKNYESLEALQKAGHFQHAIMVKPDIWKHASCPDLQGGQALAYAPDSVDFSLVENSVAIDKGKKIANVIGPWNGEAPDLGAREFGQAAPHFGPRHYDRPEELQRFYIGSGPCNPEAMPSRNATDEGKRDSAAPKPVDAP